MTKLWHDDVRPPPEGWKWARTNEEALEILRTQEVERCSLDHDLGYHDVELPEDADSLAEVMLLKGRSEQTGYDLVKTMLEEGIVPPRVHIHSWNPDGARRMFNALADADINCSVSIAPFPTFTPFDEAA